MCAKEITLKNQKFEIHVNGKKAGVAIIGHGFHVNTAKPQQYLDANLAGQDSLVRGQDEAEGQGTGKERNITNCRYCGNSH